MTHVDLPNQSKGGVAFQAHYLANTLVEHGHEVTMFTFSPAYEDCHYKVYQYTLPSKLCRLQSLLFAFYLFQTDFSDFDIIHSHGDSYLLWRSPPLVRTFHGSAQDEAKFAVSLQRKIYQSIFAYLEQIDSLVADINVGVSYSTQSRILKISDIIPCGVDTSRFNPVNPENKSTQPTILFVGTIRGRKRGHFLVDIFLQKIKPIFPDAELWLVAEEVMEGDGIINYGKVSLSKLCALYQKAWIFCLPSTYEGFGIPYVEALASGATVVASPNPGAIEILEHGKYGIIADDSELGDRLICLLSQPSLRQEYGERGLIRAQAFSWDKVVNKYEKIYAKLIK